MGVLALGAAYLRGMEANKFESTCVLLGISSDHPGGRQGERCVLPHTVISLITHTPSGKA